MQQRAALTPEVLQQANRTATAMEQQGKQASPSPSPPPPTDQPGSPLVPHASPSPPPEAMKVVKQPLFLPDDEEDENENEDENEDEDEPTDEDKALIKKLYQRENLPVDDSHPTFHEELIEEFTREENYDEDGAPVTLDANEQGGYAKGPMKKTQRARIHEHVAAFENLMEELAKEYNRPLSAIWREARLVMKFTREPNLFNLFVKRHCLEHPQAGRTMEQVREEFVAAYHAKVDGLSKEEKAELKKELIAWSEAYDKENSKAVQEAGDLYKVVLQARLEFEELARYYYRFYDIIAVGWVVSIRPGDENAMRASSAFTSTPGMVKILQNKGVSFNAVKDDIASIAKVKNMSKVDPTNFTKESEDWYMKHAKHEQVKDRISAWLIDIQNQASGRKRTKIKWTNHFIELVWKGMRIVGWPSEVPIPIPDKSLFNNLEHMRTILEAIFKTGRGELGPGKALAVEPLTEEERGWESKRGKRKNWLDVPLYVDDRGEMKANVRQALQEEAARLDKQGKFNVNTSDLDEDEYNDLDDDDKELVALAMTHNARPGAKRKAPPKAAARGTASRARGRGANRGGAASRGGRKPNKPSASHNPWASTGEPRKPKPEWQDPDTSDNESGGGQEWIDVDDARLGGVDSDDERAPTGRRKMSAPGSSRGGKSHASRVDDAAANEQATSRKRKRADSDSDVADVDEAIPANKTARNKRKRDADDDEPPRPTKAARKTGAPDDSRAAATHVPRRPEHDGRTSKDRAPPKGKGRAAADELESADIDDDEPPRPAKAQRKTRAPDDPRAAALHGPRPPVRDAGTSKDRAPSTSKSRAGADKDGDDELAPHPPKHRFGGRNGREQQQLGGGAGRSDAGRADDLQKPNTPFLPLVMVPQVNGTRGHAGRDTRASSTQPSGASSHGDMLDLFNDSGSLTDADANDLGLPRNAFGTTFDYSQSNFLLDTMPSSSGNAGSSVSTGEHNDNALLHTWSQSASTPSAASNLQTQHTQHPEDTGNAAAQQPGLTQPPPDQGAGQLQTYEAADPMGGALFGGLGGIMSDTTNMLGAMGSGLGSLAQDSMTGTAALGLNPMQLLAMGGVSGMGVGNVNPMAAMNGMGGMMTMGSMNAVYPNISPQQFQLLQAQQQLAQLQAQQQIAQLQLQLQAQAQAQLQAQAQAGNSNSQSQLPWNGTSGSGHGV